MKPEPNTSLETLKNIRLIRVTWSWGDACSLLKEGGILIGVSSYKHVEEDPEGSGFRYSIGFTDEERNLSRFVLSYSACQ